MVPTFEASGHDGAVRRDPRRAHLGELARPPPRRAVVGLSRARRSWSTSSRNSAPSPSVGGADRPFRPGRGLPTVGVGPNHSRPYGAAMTATTAADLGGPTLPQVRRLVTEVPGPRSRELAARRSAAVSAGVGSVMPVYAAAAGGGVVVDVDGNSFIDLGSGIAVTTVGNSAPAVVERRARPGGGVHPHLLHGHALRRLRGRGRGAQRDHPRPPREALGAVQLGRGGGGERGEGRPAGHRPLGRRGVRARLPRPHVADDGDDGQEHAVQARVRAVRAGGLPGADVLPVPRRPRRRRRGGAQHRGPRDATSAPRTWPRW